MNNVHGLIYAYHSFPELQALGAHRTGAALPFCGRYRLIDFALSGMMNAGIRNVGMLMQRGYLSLMEHVNGGRDWNLSLHSGGLHLLPPYGFSDAGKGIYEGSMEALGAIYAYLSNDIREEYVLLARGDLCANVDMRALIRAHTESGADITAACTQQRFPGYSHSFVPGADDFASELLSDRSDDTKGLASLEMYLLRREKLLELVRWGRERNRLHFHRDVLSHAMTEGWRVGIFRHSGYAALITSVRNYYEASMDMLDPDKRRALFVPERRIATRARSDTATYYGDASSVKNSLVGDGCRIEGIVENCVLFGGVTVGAGAEVRRCVILNDTVIGENAQLNCVICDKNAELAPYLSLSGSDRLPLVVPKGSKI